jgi:hypothetical protein
MIPAGFTGQSFVLLAATALGFSSCASAEPDQQAQKRYGEAAYLYAGESCETRDAKYVTVRKARFLEGIHRLSLQDSTGKFLASDVYFDQAAVPNESDRSRLYSATIDKPVSVDVSGWLKDCGSMNVIFLVDRLQLLR